MKTFNTVVTTVAVIYAIEKIYSQKNQIKDLKARLERVGRFSDLYYDTLSKTVSKLDGEERRETVRQFNEQVDFIRITNQF